MKTQLTHWKCSCDIIHDIEKTRCNKCRASSPVKPKPKPKSVDEAWCVEILNRNKDIVRLSAWSSKESAKHDLRVLSHNHNFFYRIRKWRAETVCEWRRVSLFSSNDGFQTGCNGKKLWAGHVDLDMYCYCGGKIKVKK